MIEFEADGVPSEKLPIPSGWRVLIAPVKLRSETDGGIALPQASLEIAENFRNIAKVLAVGSCAYDDPSFRGGKTEGNKQPWCKPGDIIVFGCHDGERITISHESKKHSLRVIKDSNVVSVINDLSTIEPLL
jgi:co-chaperonin GroES (HSP10)